MTHRFPKIIATLACPGLAAAWLASPAAAQTPLLQVEKRDATKVLVVTDDASLVVTW